MAQRRIEYQGNIFDISYEILKPDLESQSLESQDSPPILLFLQGFNENRLWQVF